jgi:hypothetical protein
MPKPQRGTSTPYNPTSFRSIRCSAGHLFLKKASAEKLSFAYGLDRAGSRTRSGLAPVGGCDDLESSRKFETAVFYLVTPIGDRVNF